MKRYLCAITVIATLLASCTKDLTQDVVGGSEVVRGELITVDANLNGTRLSADAMGKLSWSEGDEIAVILNTDGAYALDTETYVVNAETGKVAIPENTAYAFYPASIAKSLSGTTLNLTIPYNYQLGSAEAIFDRNPMKGAMNIDAGSIDFVNLMGYLMVPITGEKSVKSIALKTICRTSTQFYPISGAATLDITGDPVAGNGINMSTSNTGFTWKKITFGEAISISNAQYIYFPIPAGSYSNAAILVENGDGTSNAIYASNTHDVERGHIKMVSMENLDLANHTPANPTSLVGTGDSNFDKYASCYMVPPTAGSYSFPATLVNGTELKGGKTVEIKWAEEAGMVYDVHYDSNTNLISFKTNGKKGNVLLALTDNLYTGTSVVWLWHLWITDTPKVLSINGGTDGTKNNTYYIQDRVVGATWAPTTAPTADLADGSFSFTDDIAPEDAANAAGVYFQYQNRIPYPRTKSLDYTPREAIETLVNTKCDVMYGLSQYGQFWCTSSSGGSPFTDKFDNDICMTKAIQYPNYQYEIKKTGTTSGGSSSSVTTWIDANILNDWSTNTNSHESTVGNKSGYCFWRSPNQLDINVLQAVKTIHDPCPPGYIIQNVSTHYQTFGSRHSQLKFARAAEDDEAHSATTGYKIYGMYIDGFTDKDGNTRPLYFPCASARNNGACSQAGSYCNMGYVYQANTNNQQMYTATFSSVARYIGNGGNVQYGASSGGTKLANPSPSYAKVVNAQAYHVRCVRRSFEN